MGVIANQAHAVLVPFPAQGHINPMMQLAQKLVTSHGFIISFVVTDFDRARIIQANNEQKMNKPPQDGADMIRLVSIPDGLAAHDSRTDFAKLCKSMENSMGPLLHHLVLHINRTQGHNITCFIADVNISGWALDVAKRFQIPTAAFWPALIATYATFYNIPTLLSSGTLPSNGVPKEDKIVECLPRMPPFKSRHLPWCVGSEDDQEFLFGYTVRNMESVKETNCVIFNSFYELEAPIISTFPREASICPIGPLFLQGNSEKASGIRTGFWAEEIECVDWLDKQRPESVIYVSFGSITILNAIQFQELALGLEATGRPFLWVVRSDIMDGKGGLFPCGFAERIKDRGCVVSWAPQLSVLSHPSVACFLTHCGWNSTLESIAMGVPMICWPYFADQFLNCSYIVDVWKIGLALNANEDGIIEKGEIEDGVDKIQRKEEGVEIKKRVLKLKDSSRKALEEGGSSSVSYRSFVKAMTTYD